MNLRPRRRDDVEINLISLIDVLLFLVIFFIVSTPFVEKSEIALATTDAPPAAVFPRKDRSLHGQIALATHPWESGTDNGFLHNLRARSAAS